MTLVKQWKGWRMSCDVGEVMERLENELCSFSNFSVTSPKSQHILQPFRRFTYITVHYPTVPLLHQHHSSFSNLSFASPTSQLILQPFCCFTYVTAHSTTLLFLHLHHRNFTYWRAAHDSEFHILCRYANTLIPHFMCYI